MLLGRVDAMMATDECWEKSKESNNKRIFFGFVLLPQPPGFLTTTSPAFPPARPSLLSMQDLKALECFLSMAVCALGPLDGMELVRTSRTEKRTGELWAGLGT